MRRNKLTVWLRVGEGDTYVDYKTLAGALEAGIPYYLKGTAIPKLNGFAVLGTVYTGRNYIGCFWGDARATVKRQLSSEEMRKVARHLNRHLSRRVA